MPSFPVKEISINTGGVFHPTEKPPQAFCLSDKFHIYFAYHLQEVVTYYLMYMQHT